MTTFIHRNHTHHPTCHICGHSERVLTDTVLPWPYECKVCRSGKTRRTMTLDTGNGLKTYVIEP